MGAQRTGAGRWLRFALGLSPGHLADAELQAAAKAMAEQQLPRMRGLLERICAKPDLGVWGSNGARTYETCKRWAAET